jgi:hypothetical protein
MILAACSKTSASDSAGRPPVDNTPEVCTEYWSVVTKYSSRDNPEQAALAKAISDSYEGRDQPGAVAAANAALRRAWAKDLRPIAGRASKPELRSALSDVADRLDQSATQGAGTANPLSAMKAVTTICPSSSPSQ